ncbi:hypothetical protein CTZ28_24835 [Streptomyces shenzhenensis]|uniref:Uncharacterized protein n=1 Tax=Streptomyces shenzhenensis TaxID=943815 RepID=A0A3M0I399_9ACTN|nr:hypothetical protein CTZ28_24835 [Streptomyces shenzhenensis]
MRHTVRRSRRGVERAGAKALIALRAAARTAGCGAASRATPAGLVLGTARIPHKVPEGTADSGP